MAWLDGALERDFGYLEAERLWQVQILDSQVAASIDADFGALVQSSRRVIDEFSSRQNGFTAVGMGRPLTLTLVHEGREEDAPAFVVDDAFFPVLGVRVEQGRMPEPGRPEVVLESSFAKARFGSAAHAIGQVMEAGGKAYRVVGTLSERFVHPAPASIRRVPGLTPVVYVAAQESQFADTAENAQFLLIGRSELDFRALRASVTRALSMVGSDSG
ncbi:MAG: ABC transporter permease, partial [Xanthomonadaceae bacterium]|nr:ABC transporter permease [Xanthomonadaceae bacterium]